MTRRAAKVHCRRDAVTILDSLPDLFQAPVVGVDDAERLKTPLLEARDPSTSHESWLLCEAWELLFCRFGLDSKKLRGPQPLVHQGCKRQQGERAP